MGASGLARLQALLASAVRRPLPLGEDPAIDPAEIERMVTPGALGSTPVQRLDIYREQFWYRHWASLAEDFPTVAWALGGRAALDALSTAYLAAHPPRTWNLQRLGERLPDFVSTASPWQGDPLLADAARLDWAHVHAFDAPDAAPFDAGRLAGAPEDAVLGATVAFHPAMQALALAHPLRASRRAALAGERPPRPAPSPVFVAVWRDADCRIEDVDVERGEHALWRALADRCTLAGACEKLARADGARDLSALQADVAGWFERWVARGWVTAVELPGR